jgi:predicted component of type VI protein secretion system
VVLVRGSDVSVRPCTSESVVVVDGEQLRGGSHRLADGEAVLAGSGVFLFSETTPRSAAPAQAGPLPAFLVDDAAAVAHPLISRSTPIGRDASNAIVVRDPTASRFHAEVRREAGGFALRSMGSGGTSLNGAPVLSPRMLDEGDTVEIAFTRLRFTQARLPEGLAVASPHSAAHDETSRRSTLATERSPVGVDNEAARDLRRLWIALGLVIILALGLLAWRGWTAGP